MKSKIALLLEKGKISGLTVLVLAKKSFVLSLQILTAEGTKIPTPQKYIPHLYSILNYWAYL